MSYKIERIIDGIELGEGPHWDVETQVLYFVDVTGNTIHKYNPLTNEHTKAFLSTSTSFIIPLQSVPNKFLVSMQRNIAIVTWDGISNIVSNIEKIAEVDTDEKLRNNQLNDGKVDPTGTLWTGTMTSGVSYKHYHQRTSNLYSLSKNCELKHHFGGIYLSNGIAWSSDFRKLYYIDSLLRKVEQFDLDVEKQSISNRQSIFSLDKHNIPGIPDGQAIDVDGNLWVAIFNGSRIIKIDPRRPDTLLQTIELPAKQVTSVAFGGRNLDELYLTTARTTFFDEILEAPANGSVYRITGLGVKGFGGDRAKF